MEAVITIATVIATTIVTTLKPSLHSAITLLHADPALSFYGRVERAW